MTDDEQRLHDLYWELGPARFLRAFYHLAATVKIVTHADGIVVNVYDERVAA